MSHINKVLQTQGKKCSAGDQILISPTRATIWTQLLFGLFQYNMSKCLKSDHSIYIYKFVFCYLWSFWFWLSHSVKLSQYLFFHCCIFISLFTFISQRQCLPQIVGICFCCQIRNTCHFLVMSLQRNYNPNIHDIETSGRSKLYM